MSKITIPLLMVLAAVGIVAMSKLDRDGDVDKSRSWPSKSDIPLEVRRTPTAPAEGQREPVRVNRSGADRSLC